MEEQQRRSQGTNRRERRLEGKRLGTHSEPDLISQHGCASLCVQIDRDDHVDVWGNAILSCAPYQERSGMRQSRNGRSQRGMWCASAGEWNPQAVNDAFKKSLTSNSRLEVTRRTLIWPEALVSAHASDSRAEPPKAAHDETPASTAIGRGQVEGKHQTSRHYLGTLPHPPQTAGPQFPRHQQHQLATH